LRQIDVMGHQRQILANERLLMWGLAIILTLWIFTAFRLSGVFDQMIKKFFS
jgi:hypothetical protein